MLPRTGESRADQVRSELRARISTGEWPLHSRIPGEISLSETYGVGRGTVREAVRGLIELGMLESASGRGTFVRSRVPADAVLNSVFAAHPPQESVELRAAIEAVAARTLAERVRSATGAGTDSVPDDLQRVLARLDDTARPDASRESTPGEFHTLLVEHGANALTLAIHQGLLSRVRSALRSGELRHALDPAERERAHLDIVAAIVRGEPSRAAQLALDHARSDLIPLPADSAEGAGITESRAG